MNKDKMMWWLAEQVTMQLFFDFNNKPFKYFRHDDFDIDEEEWKKTMREVYIHHAKINGYWEEEE